MTFEIAPMTERDARAVTLWRYDAPYSDYDMDCNPDELLGRNYHAVKERERGLVGYCCYGAEARVPGGHAAGAYEDPEGLDVGLGLRPELTGRGWGPAILEEILVYADGQFAPARYRLSVAAWNERAIRAYEKAEFRPVLAFRGPTPRDAWEFVLMVRQRRTKFGF
jgi:RimJ/RimL family protein N-acetyltransferase